jgi:hypothetical protein
MDGLVNRQHPVDQLVEEKEMLSSLIYRNKNQHMKTGVYKHVNKVHYFLSLMPLEFVNDLTRQCELMINQLNILESKQKERYISLELKSRLNVLRVDTEKIVSVCCHCAHWCLLTSEKIRQKLRQLVFVPLYTVWLCTIARILGASVRLIQSYHTYYVTFRDRLTDISRGYGDDLDDDIVSILKLIGVISCNDSLCNNTNVAVTASGNPPETICDVYVAPATEDIGECMLTETSSLAVKRYSHAISDSTKGDHDVLAAKKKKKQKVR